MRFIVAALICIMLGAGAGQAQQPASGPVASAYQGNVGDWAVGTWKGVAASAGERSAMDSRQMALLVEKQGDGRILCKPIDLTDPKSAQWAAKCKIDETTLALTTALGSTITATRQGNKLFGDYLAIRPNITLRYKWEATKQP